MIISYISPSFSLYPIYMMIHSSLYLPHSFFGVLRFFQPIISVVLQSFFESLRLMAFQCVGKRGMKYMFTANSNSQHNDIIIDVEDIKAGLIKVILQLNVSLTDLQYKILSKQQWKLTLWNTFSIAIHKGMHIKHDIFGWKSITSAECNIDFNEYRSFLSSI